MIFLLFLVCYVAHTAKYLTYLLKSADVTLMANFGKVYYQTFVLYFSTFLRFNVFLFLSERLLHLCFRPRRPDLRQSLSVVANRSYDSFHQFTLILLAQST